MYSDGRADRGAGREAESRLMTDPQNKQIQDIEALLAERRKYEHWIAQLEGRRASTPVHVYTKVLGDYQARLQETQGKLSAESGVVQKLVTGLATSLAEHERQIAEKRDERAEAELRASVGEYSEKEWDKHRTKLDGAISALSAERDTVEREHDTLRALLSEATSTPASPVVPVAAVSKPDAPAPRAPAEPAKGAEPAAPVDSGGKKGDVDELAFLRSVLGRSTPFTNSGGQAAVNSPAAEAPPRRESGSTRTTTGSAGAKAVRSTEEQEPRGGAAVSVPTPPDSGAVKTLKCQECGTMNFPTEWYCERCGGELAAF
jgi:hypothetical protein